MFGLSWSDTATIPVRFTAHQAHSYRMYFEGFPNARQILRRRLSLVVKIVSRTAEMAGSSIVLKWWLVTVGKSLAVDDQNFTVDNSLKFGFVAPIMIF